MRGDFIHVKNLLVKATAGLDGWRRAIKQPLNINIDINVGQRLRRMGQTDDIRRTLNYDSLSTQIIDRIESRKFVNVEETAKSSLKTINEGLSPGEWARVTIKQPKALLLTESREIEMFTNRPGLTIERLNSLRLDVIIGINDLERVHRQEIRLDLDVSRTSEAELFTHEFTESIIEYVKKSRFLTIESFVNALAEFICTQPPKSEIIHEVQVSAAKPSALNMANAAAVQVTRAPSDFARLSIAPETAPAHVAKHLVYLAFGTNQGQRISQIQQSIVELSKRGIIVEKSSAIYQSDPMYFSDQPKFLNGVFQCRTDLDPDSLLAALKDIEYNVFNRVKLFDNGPRPFDLDILLFDNEFIDTEKLVVPHKDMLNRSFVLRPLNDLLKGSTKYAEDASQGTETTIVPLFTNDGKEKYLEFDAVQPRRRHTKLMSIMNATPDSFSDGGDLINVVETALGHVGAGAHILDIGGYSTRPGAAEVGVEEEQRRVCTAIQTIRKKLPEVVISVDTFRGSVAKEALAAGANLINDVFSGALDPTILTTAAETGAPIILSHARGTPATMKNLVEYPGGIIHGVASELRKRIDAALEAGCQPWQLILDPGLGFAKTAAQDLEIVSNFKELKYNPVLTSGLPVLPWLVGPSRKSFIGHFTEQTVPKNRVAGTIAVVTALRQQGTDIVRVHDTQLVGQALAVADRIYT